MLENNLLSLFPLFHSRLVSSGGFQRHFVDFVCTGCYMPKKRSISPYMYLTYAEIYIVDLIKFSLYDNSLIQ